MSIENGPSRHAADTSTGDVATAPADTASALCEVCRITEADLQQPSTKHYARHDAAGRPRCKWAQNNYRLYRYVRRGSPINDLACLSCLIPKGRPEGRKWADRHHRYGEPICEAAYMARRRQNGRTKRIYVAAMPAGSEFGYDANGTAFDYGTMTRQQYMTARNRT